MNNVMCFGTDINFKYDTERETSSPHPTPKKKTNPKNNQKTNNMTKNKQCTFTQELQHTNYYPEKRIGRRRIKHKKRRKKMKIANTLKV